MNRKEIITGHIVIFLAVLFFGFNITALKVLMPQWMSATDATFFRLAGGTALFWFASLFIKNDKIESKDWKKLIFSGMLGLFSYLWLFDLGIEYTSAVDVSIIMSMPPVLVVVLSHFFYKSHISTEKAVGLALSLGGALMLILIGHESGAARTMKGNLYSIGAAVCYASYLISIKQPSEKYQPITLLRWIFLFATLISLPFTLKQVVAAPIFAHFELKPTLLLLFVVLFPTFLSYLFMPMAIKRIGQDLVSIYLYLIPVITTTTAIVLKMDKLHWDQPVAVFIIFLGVYVSSRKK
ncbi:MAG: DMT family transporter [Rikenellaceae bacterium]